MPYGQPDLANRESKRLAYNENSTKLYHPHSFNQNDEGVDALDKWSKPDPGYEYIDSLSKLYKAKGEAYASLLAKQWGIDRKQANLVVSLDLGGTEEVEKVLGGARTPEELEEALEKLKLKYHTKMAQRQLDKAELDGDSQYRSQYREEE